MREQQGEGARDGDVEFLGSRKVHIGEFGAQVRVARLLAEELAFPPQKKRSVRLAEVEEADSKDDSISHGCSPEEPAPGGVFGHETTNDGSDRWSKEGPQGIEAHRLAPFFGFEEIAEYGATYGEWSGTTEPGEETERDQFCGVVGEAAGQVEDKEDGIGDLQNEDTAVELGKGAKNHGANRIGENKNGEDDLSANGVRIQVELFGDGIEAGGDHRRGERRNEDEG